MLEGDLFGEDRRRKTVLTKFRSQTICFERFLIGVELQVGSKSSPDQEISIEVINLLIKRM